uniref:Uncharacterized protein n=1 Tax=Globodera rostochiensis TaxID=31243 RepID=A0A914HSE3_GLORO
MQNKWPRIQPRRQDNFNPRRQPNNSTSHQIGQVQQVQGRASASVHGLVSSRQLSNQTTPPMANQIGQVQHFFFRHEVYQRRWADNKGQLQRQHPQQPQPQPQQQQPQQQQPQQQQPQQQHLQQQPGQPRRVIDPEEDEAAAVEVHAQPQLKRRRIEELANVTPLASSTATFAAATQIVLIKDIQRHFALLEAKKKLCTKYLHNLSTTVEHIGKALEARGRKQ